MFGSKPYLQTHVINLSGSLALKTRS